MVSGFLAVGCEGWARGVSGHAGMHGRGPRPSRMGTTSSSSTSASELLQCELLVSKGGNKKKHFYKGIKKEHFVLVQFYSRVCCRVV